MPAACRGMFRGWMPRRRLCWSC